MSMNNLVIHNGVKRVLFICKRRPASYGASYGLLNSCRFLCNALHRLGVEAKLVEVTDNNAIDKEVHLYKPTHVFIEALWVVPEKFPILINLHPHVQWYVRLHSNTPFLANEGMAIGWIKKYAELTKEYHQFHIAPNSLKMDNELHQSIGVQTVYAPNIYVPRRADESIIGECEEKNDDVLNIGCFGAIRPLKNQLIQAMAAISFADEMGKSLRFHINHTRVETHGENVHRNLIALFENSNHRLITHDWMLHEDFLKLIKSMDFGLQVSFSETFNIVAADFAYSNVPIVGSPEIEWLSGFYQANPTDIDSIVNRLWLAKVGKKLNLQWFNTLGLNKFNAKAEEAWIRLLEL